MAHGGLAQAGKVKGCTPKVEPTPKRKRKTGRAGQRVKYANLLEREAVAKKGRKPPGPNKQKASASGGLM